MEFPKRQKIPKKLMNAKTMMNIRRRQKQQQQQQRRIIDGNNLMRNKDDFTLQTIIQSSGINPLFDNLFLPFDHSDSFEFIHMNQNEFKTPREKDEQQMNDILNLMKESETIMIDTIEQQMKKESIIDDTIYKEMETNIDKIQKQMFHDENETKKQTR